MAKIEGLWQGRLIDAAGFEAGFSLNLRSRNAKVSGTYEVALVTQHGQAPQRGKLSGSTKGDKLVLQLEPSEKSDPKVQLKGDVFPCGKGLGLKGIYDVEPRKFSPLVGGVICASTEAVRADEESLIKNTAPNEGRPRRRAGGGKKR